MTIINQFREQSVTSLFKANTFDKCWDIWSPQINHLIGSTPTASSILSVGNNLADVFKLTSTGERNQSDVSGGGYAWEALVCWYLNLCLVGSRTVVFKQNKALTPSPIQDAITVNYGNFQSNTEADLIALTFPEIALKDEQLIQSQFNLSTNLKEIPGIYNSKSLSALLNTLTDKYFSKLEVCIIQCKTNWNDNAQIPMLWDMIYSVKDFIEDSNITIGRNNYHAHNLQKFRYAFVTVPTNKTEYKPNSTAVKRVSNISGGNYWGNPAKDSVCESIENIFGRNFKSGFNGNGIRDDLNTIIKGKNFRLTHDYFKL